MKFLIRLIVLVLLVLIKIGDAVIFLFNYVLKGVKETVAVWLNFKLGIKNKLYTFEKSLSLVKNVLSRFPPLTFRLPKSPKRVKKVKPVVIFPLSFGIKLKYFLQGMIFSFVFIFLPLVIFIFLQNLPKPQALTFRQIPQTTKIYDRNGILLYQIYATENRTIVPLSEIPKTLQEATIAIEDKDFYRHPGFDLAAIIRSLAQNLSGKGLQGGSTITQQLIKSALLTPETSLSRKIKEVILAFWAERIYNKDKILEMYFNQIPYGGTAWGVEAASEVYFGKKVKDLSLAESAFLAGIPKAPTTYSPFGQADTLWKKRQKEVLNKMVAFDFITKDQEDEASKEELSFMPQGNSLYAPHFVMYLKDLLVKKYGLGMVEKGGLNVVTSLDLKLQEKVQEIVADQVNKNAYLNLTNGASLVTSPSNGDILAMVGSRDYHDPNGGKFNVTTSLRQPGSSIKVVTYSAAFSRGFTAATILDDSPITFHNPGSQPYSPVNYDGKFHGKISLRMALANSLNIPAVKTLNQIGVPTMVELGKEMGIKNWGDPKNYGLSITLGGADVTMLEMATIYGVLANAGLKVDLNPILKVTDYQGNVLEEKNVSPKRIIDGGIAFILSDILADNRARAWEFGTNSPLYIPNHTVSVKTGTSDNKRDNWTIGYTTSYVVVVWVGNNDNSPMSQALASGITGAAPIWNGIMSGLLDQKPASPDGIGQGGPKMPFNVIQKDCLGRKEFFIKGTESSVNCTPLPTPTPTP